MSSSRVPHHRCPTAVCVSIAMVTSLGGCGRVAFDPIADAAQSDATWLPRSFGNLGIGASPVGMGTTSLDENRSSRFDLTERGTLTAISLYTETSGVAATAAIQLTVYDSDASGEPRDLVAAVETPVAAGPARWFTVALSEPVTVPPGVYWLGFATNDRYVRYWYDPVTSALRYNGNDLYADGPAPTFTVTGTDDRSLSIYMDYLGSQ